MILVLDQSFENYINSKFIFVCVLLFANYVKSPKDGHRIDFTTDCELPAHDVCVCVFENQYLVLWQL